MLSCPINFPFLHKSALIDFTQIIVTFELSFIFLKLNYSVVIFFIYLLPNGIDFIVENGLIIIAKTHIKIPIFALEKKILPDIFVKTQNFLKRNYFF